MVLLLCYVRTESIQLRIYIKRKRNPRVHIHSSASETEQDAYVRRNTDTKLLDPPPPPHNTKFLPDASWTNAARRIRRCYGRQSSQTDKGVLH